MGRPDVSGGRDTGRSTGTFAPDPLSEDVPVDTKTLLTPDGFLAALDNPGHHLPALDVGDRTIARRGWGHTGSGVVLVHGAAANSHWWDHIGPSIGTHHRVVALDMSGHGDSTYPGSYSFRRWADEVAAVCDELAWVTGKPTIVVGHSMGGIATLAAASRIGSSLAGIVILDSAMRPVPETEMAVRRDRSRRPAPRYADPAVAYDRFRVVPESTSVAAYVVAHLANTSLRRYEDGWGWAFDMRIFGQPPITAGQLHPVGCPGLVVRGANGLLSEETAAEIVECAGLTRTVTLEACGHHIPLERPDGVVELTLRAAAEWARDNA